MPFELKDKLWVATAVQRATLYYARDDYDDTRHRADTDNPRYNQRVKRYPHITNR